MTRAVKRYLMTPALLRRIELYKSGRWREALEELPGWEEALLDSLKRVRVGGVLDETLEH